MPRRLDGEAVDSLVWNRIFHCKTQCPEGTQNGKSGVPADQDGKTSSLLGDDCNVSKEFNCNPKWHQPKPDFPELNRAHKDAYIHYEASAEGMDFASAWEPQYQGKIRSDPTPTGMLVGSNSSNEIPTEYYLLPAIMGDEELREEAKRLCTKYSHLFSTSVSPEPADLKPMELVVDQNKWELNSNRGPARQQTEPKQKEIRVQVAKVLDLEVIRPS